MSQKKTNALSNLYLCMGCENLDLYPFRKFSNYRELYFISLVSKPYISKDSNRKGILSKWSFSKDGKTFYGTISKESRWTDGKILSPKEAALGIAKALRYRLVGARISVLGTEKIDEEGWEDRDYKGIEILSEDSFRLTFESDLPSLGGVITDALSGGARYNRMWPARLDRIANDRYNGTPDVVSNYKLIFDDSNITILYDTHKILLRPLGRTETCDFAVGYYPQKSSWESFSIAESKAKQVNYAIFNSTKFSKEKRESLSKLVRWSLSTEAPSNQAIVSGHFLKGEPGWSPDISWSKEKPQPESLKGIDEFVIGTRTKLKPGPFTARLEKGFGSYGIKLNWETLESFRSDKTSLPSIDMVIAGGRVNQGRQIWLQDLYNEQDYRLFLELGDKKGLAEGLVSSLKLITKKALSTIPINHEDLLRFEALNFMEKLVVPLSRTSELLFSRIGLDFILQPTEDDEYMIRRIENATSSH